MSSDGRLIEAKAVPMADLVERLGVTGLVRTGAELVGPCPQCGGRDRFGVNLQSGVFGCRRCGAGGDQVALVRHVLGLDFRAALDWLVGPVQELTPQQRAERARKDREAKAKRQRQEEFARRQRAGSIRRAREIWQRALDPEGTPVRDYLTRRGIDPALLAHLPRSIRYQPDARYTVPSSDRPGEWDVLHVGPAMVCAVVDATGHVTAAHRTWLDLDQPKGKLILADPRDPEKLLPSKKVLGSKKGAVIRMLTPPGADTMIMAEGVENTLTALIAEGPAPACAYWCGVDLGNMGGRMQRVPGSRWSGLPDLDDREAWLPPPWVKRLVFVQDGDSDPKSTRARLLAGLRRAMALIPGLRGQIVHAGEGRDLNDILMRPSHA